MTISLTSMGWIAVPLTVALVIFRRDLLLAWAAFLSAFQAASAIDITLSNHYPIGIQPGIFAVAVCAVVLLMVPPTQHRIPAVRPLQAVYLALGLFAAYAVLSSYVIPHQLSGQLYVYPPRAGLASGNAAPLQFSATNLSQDVYVIVAGLLFLVACRAIYNAADGSAWRKVISGWLLGGSTAAAVGIYQVLAPGLGLPFPNAFFYSNAGTAEGLQQLAQFDRLSGTFSEPSVASFYLCAVSAYALWRVIYGRSSPLVWATLALSLTAVVLTTSTTAYLTLIAVGLIVAASLLFRTHVSPRVLVRSLLVLVGCAGGAVVLFRHPEAVAEVWRQVIVTKVNSQSYTDRAAGNQNALSLIWQTFGAGAGWGSTRASSLVLNVLANGGVFGFAALTTAGVLIARLARRARKTLVGEMRIEVEAVVMALIAMLVAGVLAVPDLMQIPLWLGAGLLAGLTARVYAVVGATAARRS